jgi:hypothetical protein
VLVLKLFGLDVRAEIATVKGQIEQRVEELAVRAKQTALTSAVIVAFSTFAGLFCTLAMGRSLSGARASRIAEARESDRKVITDLGTRHWNVMPFCLRKNADFEGSTR